MKLRVIFREYDLPYVFPNGSKERGEFLGSFEVDIEGQTPVEILSIANKKATEYSEKNKSDVRVWETTIVVTPTGIQSL